MCVWVGGERGRKMTVAIGYAVTTGVPKAAMHSQRALYHLGRYGEEMMRTQPDYNLSGQSKAILQQL